MSKLPPYGHSIDKSKDPIWIWAGFKTRIYELVKAWGKNTCAFWPWLDPQSYFWPVMGRNIIIVSFMAPQDEWIERLALSLLLSKANHVAEVMWRPHGEVIGEENILITHYK